MVFLPRAMRHFLLILCLVASAPAQDYSVTPREASWESAREQVFDTAWLLPRASADELARSPKGSYDLVTRLEELLALRFEAAPGAMVNGELARLSSLGDLAALCAARRQDAAAVQALLDRAKKEWPEMWARLGPAATELLREGRFLSSKWNPGDDRSDDGFLVAPPRELGASGVQPFAGVEGNTRLVQVATLIHADLAAIRSTENDYRTRSGWIGEHYQFIRPVPESFLRGIDPDGRPFAMLRVEFRADLPFPFKHYDCDLRVLHRLDAQGRLISNVWSPSRGFYWMAGQEVHLPVLDSAGGFVGILCVRVFGTDLRGVPDGTDNLEAGARTGLGNVKRGAERLWGAGPRQAPVYQGAVPEFAVHGRR